VSSSAGTPGPAPGRQYERTDVVPEGGGPVPAGGLAWLDANVAAAGCLRTGPWAWADGEWSASARKITVPAGVQVRRVTQASPLTVEEAVREAAAGTVLTVTQVGHDGEPVPGTSAVLWPAGTVPGAADDGLPEPGVLVDLPPCPPGPPGAARARIDCYSVAADIAEAATLYAAAAPARHAGASRRDRLKYPGPEL
jgi:hypothetical protein